MIHLKSFKHYLFLSIIIFCITACNDTAPSHHSVKRFEKDLFEIVPDSLEQELPDLLEKYPDFLPVFSEHIIHIGHPGDVGYTQILRQFINDPVMFSVYQDIILNYPDFGKLADEIIAGIRNFERAMGRSTHLKIITFNSGFNQNFVTLEGTLCIGLDHFLGANSQYYPQLGFPEYVTRLKTKEQLPVQAVKAWIQSEMNEPEPDMALLDQMIYEGKILFTLEQFLPKIKLQTIFGYSEDQLDWCKVHEKQMWAYFAEHELLFSTDRMNVKKYTQPAPFTSNFGKDAPGRASTWIGYQIVKKYVIKNKRSLNDLLLNDSPRQILAASGYKP